MNLLTIFILLNIANVIGSTIRSLCTINCNKWVASFVNAIYFGFYTVVIIYTLSDLPLLLKAGIVALCNLVGVFIVKLIQEKVRKDKLWLVKVTIPARNFEKAKNDLKTAEIPYSYIDLNKYFVFDCYCNTQKETTKVTDLSKKYHGKCFATENKLH